LSPDIAVAHAATFFHTTPVGLLLGFLWIN